MRSRLVIAVIVSLMCAAALLAGVNTALATCGGGPCSCGSTVDVDTTLSEAMDPVCSVDPLLDICLDTGLIVKPGVILDLGGCTIRGAALSTFGIEAGAGATVRSGKIIGFGIAGVSLGGNNGRISNLQITDGATFGIVVVGSGNRVEKSIVRRQGSDGLIVNGRGNVVSNLQVSDSGLNGIEVVGANNVVERSIVARADQVGILFFGDGNKAQLNTAEDNGRHGVAANGDNLVVARNTTARNGVCGIYLFNVIGSTSDRGLVDRNQVKLNDFAGLCVDGTAHKVSLNVVASNGVDGVGDGILVMEDAAGNVVDRNRSTGNQEFGIRDESSGSGTGGTANTYKGNICSGNGVADSSPAGLCR